MRLSGRAGLLAFNASIVLVGASITFALLLMAQKDRPGLDGAAGMSARSAPHVVAIESGRLAFANRALLQPAEKPFDTQVFRPSVTPADVAQPEPGTETATETATASISPDEGVWSADIRRARPGSQNALGPKAREILEGSAKTRRSGQSQVRHTLKSRLAEIEPVAKARLVSRFQAAKVAWPPDELSFVAIKDQRLVELYARQSGGVWTFVHGYPVLAASGGLGPKLHQGDKQVPEGVYRISYLNPNSAYHVSLRVNYPNAFDRKMAAKDGRRKLGGDIMIHGKKSSAGCLAMGDEVAEELFLLAAQTGLKNIQVIIAPSDFRKKPPPTAIAGQPAWVPRLYAEIATAMAPFPAPAPQQRKSPGLLSLFFSKG